MKECEQKKGQECHRIINELKPVQIDFVQKGKKQKHSDKDCRESALGGGGEEDAPKFKKRKSVSSTPDKKKARRTSLNQERCCVGGYDKRQIFAIK